MPVRKYHVSGLEGSNAIRSNTASGVAALDPLHVRVARTLGATRPEILRTVVLPMIRPYVISGFCFVFVISLNEYIIAVMTVGAVFETLPMKIFNALRYGYTPSKVAFLALHAWGDAARGVWPNGPHVARTEVVSLTVFDGPLTVKSAD